LKTYLQKVHYNKKNNIYLCIILGFFSLFYRIVIEIKNYLYEKKILKSGKVNAKVICVGNITTGGVGKSPLVCEIANYLAKDKKVAIISRGYGGQLDNKNVNLIKDYQRIIISDPILTGDEPYMIAKNTDKVVVLTCADRIKASDFAIKYLNASIIILDDGFSNRKIQKDLTLLLVDKEKQFGNGNLLPLGPLREPIKEIKRADKIVLINKQATSVIIPDFQKPICECKFVKDKYYNSKTNQEVMPDKEKDVVAFCAIGQPQQFYNYLYDDFNVIKTKNFEDHHVYTKSEIEKLTEYSKTLITTQKDEVKLVKIIKNMDIELIVLKLKIEADIKAILDE